MGSGFQLGGTVFGIASAYWSGRRVCIYGTPRAGKSTLFNFIALHNILPIEEEKTFKTQYFEKSRSVPVKYKTTQGEEKEFYLRYLQDRSGQAGIHTSVPPEPSENPAFARVRGRGNAAPFVDTRAGRSVQHDASILPGQAGELRCHRGKAPAPWPMRPPVRTFAPSRRRSEPVDQRRITPRALPSPGGRRPPPPPTGTRSRRPRPLPQRPASGAGWGLQGSRS